VYGYLRSRWQKLHQQFRPEEDFEAFWAASLQRGGVFETEASPREATLRSELQSMEFVALGRGTDTLTLVTYPSPFLYDGRMANRPWLQELPDPLTHVVWDNWVEIHPEDARRLGIEHGDLVRIEAATGSMEVAPYVTDFARPGVVSVPMGQGHVLFGRYAEGRGANPMPLLPTEPDRVSGGLNWTVSQVRVTPTGRRHELVSTAGSTKPHGREIVQTIPLATLQSDPPAGKAKHPVTQIYPEHEHPVHRWAMTIDVNACIGCGACVTACYAENNIPVMGKEQVGIGREMSWIRIERVDKAEEDGVSHNFLPMLCQHCDYAPCEPVCPVEATTHSDEGLNEMTYNRCVGTRYCLNNCPYKVRRFNFLQYSERKSPTLKMLSNPDVTVRFRGVMEKCTYCVQRINVARIQSKKEDRKIRDGEIITACQSVCPTRAIVFGDLNDDKSAIAKVKTDPRDYGLLVQLNTRPRTTYIARITNPNPELGAADAHTSQGAHHG